MYLRAFGGLPNFFLNWNVRLLKPHASFFRAIFPFKFQCFGPPKYFFRFGCNRGGEGGMQDSYGPHIHHPTPLQLWMRISICHSSIKCHFDTWQFLMFPTFEFLVQNRQSFFVLLSWQFFSVAIVIVTSNCPVYWCTLGYLCSCCN
jgi:hypothetical protein